MHPFWRSCPLLLSCCRGKISRSPCQPRVFPFVCMCNKKRGGCDRFNSYLFHSFFGVGLLATEDSEGGACSSSFSAQQTWVLPPVWHMAQHSMKQFNAYFFNACDVSFVNLVPCNGQQPVVHPPVPHHSPPPTLCTPYPAWKMHWCLPLFAPSKQRRLVCSKLRVVSFET